MLRLSSLFTRTDQNLPIDLKFYLALTCGKDPDISEHLHLGQQIPTQGKYSTFFQQCTMTSDLKVLLIPVSLLKWKLKVIV